MLVLARKSSEIIMIGDDIEIKVIAIDQLKVILGFRAPRDVPVHREEIYKRIHSLYKKENHSLLIRK